MSATTDSTPSNRPNQAGERVTDLELTARLRSLVTHENLWSAGARHGDEDQLQLDLEPERANLFVAPNKLRRDA